MIFKSFIALIATIIGGLGVFMLYPRSDTTSAEPAVQGNTGKTFTLLKYTIDSLSREAFEPSPIEIGEAIEEYEAFTSYMFYFYDDGKKVSGMINVPKQPGEYPVILMIRGYAPLSSYTTGVGTKRGAEYLASHGFVTISPDYLGYGESDEPSDHVFEKRFQTYTTTLALLSSVGNINPALKIVADGVHIDPEKVGIWGHSNGGQIALTTLEITREDYPTALWNPVSKPFPYSILFYTDEYDDFGKALRKDLASFEEEYDVDLFSLSTYLDRIQAPIQLHQGMDDIEVPVVWSNELAARLKNLDKDIEYHTYHNSDHNLMPGGWSTAIERSAQFYREKLSSNSL